MWKILIALALTLSPWTVACDGGGAASISDGLEVAADAASDTAPDPADGASDAAAEVEADGSVDPGPAPCFAPGRVWNIAHRGGRLLRPEHTLVAFEHALEVGADVLELDLHRTADGVVVVLHDDTVDRTTDGKGNVSGLTLAELKALDAGYRFTDDGGQTFPWRGEGLTVPTLDEVLSAFGGQCMSIELKDAALGTADAALALLDAHEVTDRVLLISFSDEPLQHLRALRPELVTGLSAAEMFEFLLLEDEEAASWKAPALIFQAPHEQVDRALLERAHALGLIVQPWTVNEPAEMQRLIDLGVDGLITDDPQALQGLLAP